MMRTRTSRVLAAAGVLALSALPALAQSELKPPRSSEPPSSPKFWMYAVFLLLLAAVVFAASLRSKRTHQD